MQPIAHEAAGGGVKQGEYAKALEYYSKDLAISEKALGPAHPSVGSTLGNMAGVYQEQGEYAKAIEHYGRALAIDEAALGKDHLDVGIDLFNMGLLFKA